MKQEEIDNLVAGYLAGKATRQEQKLLNQWYNAFDDETVLVPASEEDEKEKTRRKIFTEVKSKIATNQKHVIGAKTNRFVIFMKAAAAILILAAASYGLYRVMLNTPSAQPKVAMVQKTTKAGQKSKVTLSDGTVIHLNSASSLSFPEQFDGDTRKITLSGEAFFEVKRDESKPFIVTSGKVETKVLGTSFNIRAYSDDENLEVAVATGKVQVSIGSGLQPMAQDSVVMLVPDQAAIFNTSTNELNKTTVQTENLMAWKDGWLIFESRKISEVADVLERWYGTEIIIGDEELKDKVVTLKQQNESLKSVLEILSYLADFEFIIEKEKVTITKKSNHN